MKYFIAIVLCIWLCVSCKHAKDTVVASVYNEKLLLTDLQHMLPDFNENTDSIAIQTYLIDKWIQKQAMLYEAEQFLSHDEKDFDKQLKDYYESLLIFTYENKKVEALLDKEVSENEIRNYYEAHKSEFEMKKNIVKVNYIKFPLDFNQLEVVKRLLFNDNPSLQDQKRLENICIKHAENMYMENDWLLFDDILKEIPINTYNQEQYLQKNRNIELSDSNNVYLVKINDFKINEAYSPLSIEKENIKEILLNQRRQKLVKQIRNNALQKAKKEHAVGINYNKTVEKQ
ncbi:MAG: hypothetical protein PHC83_06000 [Bacteroidales bacterium]|nr:hypothetical protein [Bacteroidales bacterium]